MCDSNATRVFASNLFTQKNGLTEEQRRRIQCNDHGQTALFTPGMCCPKDLLKSFQRPVHTFNQTETEILDDLVAQLAARRCTDNTLVSGFLLPNVEIAQTLSILNDVVKLNQSSTPLLDSTEIRVRFAKNATGVFARLESAPDCDIALFRITAESNSGVASYSQDFVFST